MDIDEHLLKIVKNELGSSSADLFFEFYHGFSKREQIEGAREILGTIVGATRTKELLGALESNNK